MGEFPTPNQLNREQPRKPDSPPPAEKPAERQVDDAYIASYAAEINRYIRNDQYIQIDDDGFAKIDTVSVEMNLGGPAKLVENSRLGDDVLEQHFEALKAKFPGAQVELSGERGRHQLRIKSKEVDERAKKITEKVKGEVAAKMRGARIPEGSTSLVVKLEGRFPQFAVNEVLNELRTKYKTAEWSREDDGPQRVWFELKLEW